MIPHRLHWCRRRDSNPHVGNPTRDFKSLVSAIPPLRQRLADILAYFPQNVTHAHREAVIGQPPWAMSVRWRGETGSGVWRGWRGWRRGASGFRRSRLLRKRMLRLASRGFGNREIAFAPCRFGVHALSLRPRHPPAAAPARLASPRARPARPLLGFAHIQSQGICATMARRNLILGGKSQP